LVAPLIIGLYRVWLKQTLGGVSGDCLGAGVEITELALLAVVAISLTI
jgi:adenosylcobinamide-GDP ribazoletransferase